MSSKNSQTRISDRPIDQKALTERIRQLRTRYAGERGKTIFAKALGISPSTYSYYEGGRVPSAEILWRMCEVTGADVRWLLTGQAPSGDSGSGAESLLPAGLVAKISAVLAKQPQSASALEAFVDFLTEKAPVEKPAPDDGGSDEFCWVPLLGRTAAGMVHFWQSDDVLPSVTDLTELIERHRNSGRREIIPEALNCEAEMANLERLDEKTVKLVQVRDVDSSGFCEFVSAPEVYRRYQDAFALHIDGDSMAPHVCDGDVVVLSPSVPATNGCRSVVKLVGQIGATCKIVRWEGGQIHLIPSNERYDIKVHPEEEVAWALAVLWCIRWRR